MCATSQQTTMEHMTVAQGGLATSSPKELGMKSISFMQVLKTRLLSRRHHRALKNIMLKLDQEGGAPPRRTSRWIYRLKDTDTDRLHRYCLVQYYFDVDDHSFLVKGHGNQKAKESSTGMPYKQTAKSVRDTLKQTSKQCPAKEAMHQATCQTGGILNAGSSASVPRNYRQVANFRHQQKAAGGPLCKTDVLAAVMQQ